MIQLGTQTEVMVAIKPIDFRCGIESLCGLVKRHFQLDPFKGTFFLFTNKRRTGIKILAYDGQGFWICYKRFSQGKLNWWPQSGESITKLDAKNVLMLLYNSNHHNITFQENWKKI